MALTRIAAASTIDERRIRYSGEISHQQNRAFVNLRSIHLSARSTDSRINIGDVLHQAFIGVGSAGGHQEMAGGEIPLGIFADDTSDDQQVLATVEQVVTARLIAGLNLTEPAAESGSGQPDQA